MPRTSSSVVTATTNHLLRRRSRFVLGDSPVSKHQLPATMKPAAASVR